MGLECEAAAAAAAAAESGERAKEGPRALRLIYTDRPKYVGAWRVRDICARNRDICARNKGGQGPPCDVLTHEPHYGYAPPSSETEMPA